MATQCPKCQHENPEDSSFCSKCTSPLKAPEDISVTRTLESPPQGLTTGSTFAGRYKIIEELGKGGMGAVYKALDTQINEEVAIKLIRPEIASDEKTLERFSNELKLARKISHKNVCRMYHLEREEEKPYISMEYVKGEDLKSFIRKKEKLAQEEIISIAKQVCEGLAEAHELGVVHRDLKPQNIMIDDKERTKIMDFGIARSVEAPGVTATGVIIGTPDYISPEQAEGEEADQRSDIYSLGIILYEMVTGSVPFKGDTAFSVALKHKSQLPQDPRKHNPEVSGDLSRLILICMEKDRERRYQKADELLSDLMNIEEGFPLGTKIQPRRETFRSALIRKKLLIPAFVVALAIIVIAIWQNLSQKKYVTPLSTDKPSIAIMYFKNDTGDEGLGHWRSALSQWLITDITQSRFIKVLPMDRLFSILRKLNLLEAQNYASEDLKKVAAEGRVNHIFQASLSKAGDNFRIDYSLLTADTIEVIGSDYVKGIGEESLPTMVDELTRKIKRNFKLTSKEIASDIDKAVEKITTSYPAAYKYYVEGRKHHYRGDYRQSIPFMERAIEIDPEFAMAYRSLSASYSNQGYREESRKYLKKAFELSDRASDIERYRIQGDYYFVRKNYDKAIEAYNKLFELDPDHIAHNNMGGLYKNLEEWDKAIEHLEVCRKIKHPFFGSYGALGNCYAAKGMYQKAREAYQDYINNFSDIALIHEHLAKSYACEGKYDPSLEEADKAIAIDPINPMNYRKGRIYQLMGRCEDAEKGYLKLLESENRSWQMEARRWLEVLYRTQGKFEKAKGQAQLGLELSEKFDQADWKLLFHSQLGDIYSTTGKFEKALQEFSKWWDISVKSNSIGNQTSALYSKGRTLVEMKSINEAVKVADELKQFIESSIYPKNIRLYDNLIGKIEFEKKNYSKAIEYFEKAYAGMPAQYDWHHNHAMFIYPLGLAYFMSGDFEKAQEEYERILAMTTGRLWWGDLYAKSFYMLGKIHEQQGDTTKAIENYEKFLALWKDADPGIAEVEDARKRLAGLKNFS